MAASFTSWFPSGFRLIDGGKLNKLFNNPQVSTQDSITAYAGGGQDHAVALGAGINRVTVCATNADSVKLPPSANFSGGAVIVINDGAANLAVFPSSGDSIDGGAADASVTITTPKRAVFYLIGTEWSSLEGVKAV